MKKLIFLFVFALVTALFIGCASPVTDQPASTHKMYVVNSMWEVVKTVEVSTAKELVSDNTLAEVEQYNTETLDDFLRVYYDTVPDLAEAPLVDVYICNPADYSQQKVALGISRQALIDDIDLWRYESQGKILFIDHVPPQPIVTPPASMYAWYALYVVDDSNGDIIYEDHCGWTIDEVWDGQWILEGGWRDADHYRETTRSGYVLDLGGHPTWRLVERHLYTDPTP